MLPQILLIEDNVAVGQAIIELLTRTGSRVTRASNGSEGLALIRKQQFDLVITGSRMPVTDGVTLITELVKFTELPPIISLSSKSVENKPGWPKSTTIAGPAEFSELIPLTLLVKRLSHPTRTLN